MGAEVPFSLRYCYNQKARGASSQNFTLAANNNRDQLTRSVYNCLFTSHIYGCCSLHTSCSWQITHSAQCQPRGCNNIPSFFNEPHQSHSLFVKAAPGTTVTSWSQHHFVVIRKPKRQVRKASHCGSNQQ